MPIYISILLILFSAVLHALWNTLLKTRKDQRTDFVALSFLSNGAALCLGFSSIATVLSIEALAATGFSAAFGVGYVIATANYLRLGSLGLGYSISRAGALVFIWPLSWYFLGETITIPATIGVIAIALAVTLSASWQEEGWSRAAFFWSLTSAACMAGNQIGYKLALNADVNPFSLFGISGLMTAFGSFAFLGKRRFQKIISSYRTQFPVLALMAVAHFGSFMTFLYALKSGGVGQLSTLRNLGIIFTAAGAHYLGERRSHRTKMAIALAAAGTILIGWH